MRVGVRYMRINVWSERSLDHTQSREFAPGNVPCGSGSTRICTFSTAYATSAALESTKFVHEMKKRKALALDTTTMMT